MTSELYQKALKILCERESYWLRQKAESFKRKKIVIFPAGPTAQAFYDTLINDYGIEAEFFIDNNPKLDGKMICGKPVKLRPWERSPHFTNEYAVLVPTTPIYCFEIAKQLEKIGVAYMYANAFEACHLWNKFNDVLKLLDDERSKLSYLSTIYFFLTCENAFIQHEEHQYFSVKQFFENRNETIVDAGAYVGDTVEEFIKRGTGSGSLKIFVFEPDKKALKKLEHRIERLKNEWLTENYDIKVVPAGLGAETKVKKFKTESNNVLTLNNEGDIQNIVYSLDDYFKDKEPFTLLKADIEGGELDMLRGAANMIKSNMPKIAVSIYHSVKDFVQIAEYIHSLVPQYRMAVRNHSSNYEDTVLYCWI
jgi:FkbM family methyltransferase